MRTVVLLLLGACVNDRPAPPAPPTSPPPPDAPTFVATPMDASPVAKPGDRSISIAKDSSAPTKIVVTATDILWLDELAGNVVKVPKAGGALVELATKQERPLDLAVDGDTVYWTTRTGNGDSDSMTDPKPTGGVWSVPLSGGKPFAIATKRAFPHAIAIDGTGVFFAEQGVAEGKGAKLSRVGKRGGAVTTFHAAGPGGIAIEAGQVYWSVGGTCTSTNGAPMPDDGSIWTSPIARSAPKQLASKLRCPEGIAVDADSIYVANMDDGQILRIPKAGGPAVVAATDEPGTRWIAVDATTIYWVNQRTAKIKRRAKAGGPVELLVQLKGPQGIAVDDQFVYFTDTDAGTVRKLAK